MKKSPIHLINEWGFSSFLQIPHWEQNRLNEHDLLEIPFRVVRAITFGADGFKPDGAGLPRSSVSEEVQAPQGGASPSSAHVSRHSSQLGALSARRPHQSRSFFLPLPRLILNCNAIFKATSTATEPESEK